MSAWYVDHRGGGFSLSGSKVVPQAPGRPRFAHDRMIHQSSRTPAIDPITMPAMAPPLRLLPDVPLPPSATTVVVAWRLARIFVMACGKVLVASDGGATVGAIG